MPILEMMQKQVGRQKIALPQMLEYIPLAPSDLYTQTSRPRSQIHPTNRIEIIPHPFQEPSLSGPNLHQAPTTPFRQLPHRALHPSEVAHQDIDPPQIPPTPHRFRIVCRQAIENFRVHRPPHVAKLEDPPARVNRELGATPKKSGVGLESIQAILLP